MRYGLTICAAAVFAVLMSMASVASALDSEGLIAAYPMNEGDGDEVKDISQNEYHGRLLSGAGWYKGADAPTGGFAVEFVGGQSHMAADNVFSSLPNNAITIGAWFYLTNHTTYEGILSGSEGGKGTPAGNCCQY